MSIENIKSNFVNVSLAAGGVHRVLNLAQVLFAEMVGATSHVNVNEGAPTVLITVGDFRDVVAGAGAAGMDNGPLFGAFTNVDGGGVFVSNVVVNFDKINRITATKDYYFSHYGIVAAFTGYDLLESIADVLGGMGHSIQDVGIFRVTQTDNTILPPVQAAASSDPAGGTIPDDTYFLEITALNSNGETTGSNEVTITTAGGDASSITAHWALSVGADAGYKVYIGTVAGAEGSFFEVPAGETSVEISGLPGDAGTVPTVNTATDTSLNTSEYINVKNVTHQVPTVSGNWDTFFIDGSSTAYVDSVMDLVGG